MNPADRHPPGEDPEHEPALDAQDKTGWGDPPPALEHDSPAARRSAARVAARAKVAGNLPAARADVAVDPPAARGPASAVARNTTIFAVATGLSRIAGLVREVVARGYFGTTGPASAFTLAFQVPNLVRGLFADAALGAAFVPVFTEMLEEGRKQDAFRLASTLFFCILAALGAITAAFILGAGFVMPLFTSDKFDQGLVDLTVGLSQVMFPIVVLLGINGLVVGILNAHGEFSVAALAPLVWNAIIIVSLVALHGVFEGDDELYAYAIGILVGTIVQLAICLPGLRRLDFRLSVKIDLRDERLRRVFVLMIPVTIGLGIINFDLLINSVLGGLISEETPAAIDAAFRLYMLPQGVFSVAIATVLFPTLSRYVARRDLTALRSTMSSGIRLICLLLIPAAVFSAVLAEPIVRLVYERGAFDAESTEQVKLALFWFSFSLPFAGANLLLTRTFFSLQKPWTPTKLALLSLGVNVAVSLATYGPFGISGPVIGTAVASATMAVGQYIALRPHLGGDIEFGALGSAIARISLASAVLGGITYALHRGLEGVLGASLPAQALAVGLAAAAGFAAYAAAVLALGVPEARRVEQAVAPRLRRTLRLAK